MDNSTIGEAPSEIQCDRIKFRRLICFCFCLVLALLTAVMSQAQTPRLSKPPGAEPIPEPAIPAILSAFDRYEVVGMPEAHGLKDIDDFILSLIRNPAFPDKVNDIEVECGNSLYQPILDRYIAGQDVPFTDVRKVWRNTTQSMCGTSQFFEEFFPLVRAINQKLPAGKRLRVLAGDPPIDWDQVKTPQDTIEFGDRSASIASVMEKEVLSKHRKALMLFGEFHLFHGATDPAPDAVSIYEKDYPNITFIIGDLSTFNMGLPTSSTSPFATWLTPSVARAKGTWLGALGLNNFLPAPAIVDKDCKNARIEFPKSLQRPMADLVDAFLYLGPPNLTMIEPLPADYVLDMDYRRELQRRNSLVGMPTSALSSPQDYAQTMIRLSENPVLVLPKPPDLDQMVQHCLELRGDGDTRK